MTIQGFFDEGRRRDGISAPVAYPGEEAAELTVAQGGPIVPAIRAIAGSPPGRPGLPVRASFVMLGGSFTNSPDMPAMPAGTLNP